MLAKCIEIIDAQKEGMEELLKNAQSLKYLSKIIKADESRR